MSDNVWNYDMSQCPLNVPVIVIIEGQMLPRISVFSCNDDRFLLRPEKWAAYTPPSEPEVWIKHDNNSFPKCHPFDSLKLRTKVHAKVETVEAQHCTWYAQINPIIEYCIVKKYQKDSSV